MQIFLRLSFYTVKPALIKRLEIERSSIGQQINKRRYSVKIRNPKIALIFLIIDDGRSR